MELPQLGHGARQHHAGDEQEGPQRHGNLDAVAVAHTLGQKTEEPGGDSLDGQVGWAEAGFQHGRPVVFSGPRNPARGSGARRPDRALQLARRTGITTAEELFPVWSEGRSKPMAKAAKKLLTNN